MSRGAHTGNGFFQRFNSLKKSGSRVKPYLMRINRPTKIRIPPDQNDPRMASASNKSTSIVIVPDRLFFENWDRVASKATKAELSANSSGQANESRHILTLSHAGRTVAPGSVR